MKRLKFLSMVAIIVFAIYGLITTGCSNKAKKPGTKLDSSYVLFVVDFNIHSTALAFSYCNTIDTVKVVDGEMVPFKSVMHYVQWPVPITDSVRRTIKNKEGKDSTQLQWVTVKEEAILHDFGMNKPVRK